MINTFKVGRLYRNPKDHNQVIIITGGSEWSIRYYELQWTHEEYTSPINVFHDWELIDENERSSETD